VTYKGKNSLTCSQTIAIWRWTTGTWVRLDRRDVGTSEVAIEDLSPPGPAADFVSDGDVRVRVGCRKDGSSFTTRADLLRLDYVSSGGL
jgi:hypothetical protein